MVVAEACLVFISLFGLVFTRLWCGPFPRGYGGTQGSRVVWLGLLGFSREAWCLCGPQHLIYIILFYFCRWMRNIANKFRPVTWRVPHTCADFPARIYMFSCLTYDIKSGPRTARGPNQNVTNIETGTEYQYSSTVQEYLTKNTARTNEHRHGWDTDSSFHPKTCRVDSYDPWLGTCCPSLASPPCLRSPHYPLGYGIPVKNDRQARTNAWIRKNAPTKSWREPTRQRRSLRRLRLRLRREVQRAWASVGRPRQ